MSNLRRFSDASNRPLDLSPALTARPTPSHTKGPFQIVPIYSFVSRLTGFL